MKEEDATIKKQVIAQGIIMEKFQQKVKDDTHYVIQIDMQLFNTLEFTVDFTGSSKVRIQGSSSLIKTTIVQPFTKTEVARLVLEKKWNLKTKFRFSMKLPSIELQKKHINESKKTLQALLNQNQTKYSHEVDKIDALLETTDFEIVDPDFPPMDSSIDVVENVSLQRYECLVDWRNSRQFSAIPTEKTDINEVQLFPDRFEISKIKNGKLDDFWLLSSIGALAEKPEFLRRMITKKTNKKSIIYIIKLFEMGRLKQLLLDDYFPCYPLGSQLFASYTDNETWVSVIEKAFAKLWGNYSRLSLGQIKMALVTLTNCPTISYNLLENNSPLIYRAMILYDDIKRWINKRYIVVVSTGKELQSLNASQNVSDHGYSILNFLEIDHAKFPLPNSDKTISKLVCVRNPWGLFEWTGDWSVNSPFWTEQIQNYYQEYLKDTLDCFWIPIENLVENFACVTVCMTQSWNVFQNKNLFVDCYDKNNPEAHYFSSSNYYKITLDSVTRIVFGIHQEDERSEGVLELRPNIDIGLVILSYSNGNYKLEKHIDSEYVRESFLEISLKAGVYLIIPKSVGLFLNPENKLKLNTFDIEGKLERSIFKNIFDKYDQYGSDFLDSKSFVKNLAELELDKIDSKLKPTLENIKKDVLNSEKLTRKNFDIILSKIITIVGQKKVSEVFRKFGLSDTYTCDDFRSFAMTIHSEKELNVEIKDALKDKMELISFKLMLKLFGRSIEQKKNAQGNNENQDIDAYFYFNEFNY